jgi:ketosteroid isomerase-like protein
VGQKDAESLVSIFHPDMVWPWPPDGRSHDPMTWVFDQGRYDRERWRGRWQSLFVNYDLVHNERKTLRIEVSEEGDGAFAVVDVDTLWRNKSTGEDLHWRGRSCKGYTKTVDGWKLIMHTGLLDYGS